MSRGADPLLAGSKSGQWTLIERFEYEDARPKWRCECSCGTKRLVAEHNLRSGLSRSCGHGKAAIHNIVMAETFQPKTKTKTTKGDYEKEQIRGSW